MSDLKISIDGVIRVVPRTAYVAAKTKQMVEFGYPNLTVKDVDAQVTALIEGKKFGDGLTVIGMFMQDEVVLGTT